MSRQAYLCGPLLRIFFGLFFGRCNEPSLAKKKAIPHFHVNTLAFLLAYCGGDMWIFIVASLANSQCPSLAGVCRTEKLMLQDIHVPLYRVSAIQ